MSEEKQLYGDQPAAIIESPRQALALQDSGLVDYKVWGWVKLSARFRPHIKALRGAKLAIWLCISLSIDEGGKSKMTVKELCEMTGYSHTEVLESIREMEAAGYMTVNRDERRNIYAPEFAARGENAPTETVKKLESSGAYQVESSPAIEKTRPTYKELKELTPPKGDIVDAVLKYEAKPQSIKAAIQEHFRLKSNFSNKFDRQWMEWAVGENITAEQIARAAQVWKMDKRFNWQQPTLKGIFEKWLMLMDAGETSQPELTPKVRIIK